MRKCVFVCAALLALIPTADAAAQSTKWSYTPLGRRVFININGAVQPGDQTVERSASFDLYDEKGDFKSSQTIEGSGLLDIGGGARVYRNIGAGLAYTRFTTYGTANISGSLPHPAVFDRPRAYSATASDLIHKEQALHLYAIYFLAMPKVPQLEVGLFGGPSFFNDVDQDFPIGITFTETGPTFDTATIAEVREGRGSTSTTGFNVGVDVSYAITGNVGVGGLLRYTKADVDYDVGAIKSSITAGNVQFGAGLRLRF